MKYQLIAGIPRGALHKEMGMGRLRSTIHKFGGEFIHSGLSVVRPAHHPDFFEGQSEHGKAFH